MPALLDQFYKYAVKSGHSESSYIVGGTVRDLVLSNEIKDADIAFRGDALSIGRFFANTISASFVLLDEKFGIARIALRGEYIDICSLYGDSLIDDLGNRDLTINAMAIPLSEFWSRDRLKKIIDPYSGLRDLEDNRVRMVSEKNLMSDPLRMLRVYRFAATLGFAVDASTTSAVQKHAALISHSAPERITTELRHILGCSSSLPIFRIMKDSGLLTALFPEVSDYNDEKWNMVWSSLERIEDILRRPEACFPGNDSFLREYFASAYRVECLKLTILLNGRAMAEQAAQRLKLSNKEAEFINLISAHNQIIASLDSAKRSAITGLLRELGDDIYAALAFGIASAGNVPDQDRRIRLAREIVTIYHEEYLPRLRRLPFITGDDLIQQFGLSPSPFFKDILSSIELLALEGRITTRDEALRAAGEMIKNKDT
jgi:tRNA nucleotidyltransferase/poly(A) polymerase